MPCYLPSRRSAVGRRGHPPAAVRSADRARRIGLPRRGDRRIKTPPPKRLPRVSCAPAADVSAGRLDPEAIHAKVTPYSVAVQMPKLFERHIALGRSRSPVGQPVAASPANNRPLIDPGLGREGTRDLATPSAGSGFIASARSRAAARAEDYTIYEYKKAGNKIFWIVGKCYKSNFWIKK